MPKYVVKNAQDRWVNQIEIEPAQIASWEALTGLTLELPPEPESSETPDLAEMEAVLNELDVQTRE